MQTEYWDAESNSRIYSKRAADAPPHLHGHVECVYLLDGALRIGQERELYPMERGDFAVVFPDVIHSYRVSGAGGRVVYLMIPPERTGPFAELFRQSLPENPVIPAGRLHGDVPRALDALRGAGEAPQRSALLQGYLLVILARALPELQLRARPAPERGDLVYQIVRHISRHFREEVTLGSTAAALGYSPCALSRAFSATFHTNFNGYLNGIRLSYARERLENSDLPVTEIALDSGFPSLRTFNRVCRERLGMSPREYRKLVRAEAKEGAP